MLGIERRELEGKKADLTKEMFHEEKEKTMLLKRKPTRIQLNERDWISIRQQLQKEDDYSFGMYNKHRHFLNDLMFKI
jgi:hypothetical protein